MTNSQKRIFHASARFHSQYADTLRKTVVLTVNPVFELSVTEVQKKIKSKMLVKPTGVQKE